MIFSTMSLQEFLGCSDNVIYVFVVHFMKVAYFESNRVLSINLAIVLHVGNYGCIVLYTLQLIIGDYIALKV